MSLTSLRGKTVVLNFFASWCNPCKREAPVLEHLWQEDRSRGLVVLGIDGPDFHGDGLRFVHAHDLTYPVVFDHSGATAMDQYAGAVWPVTYVLNRRGRIVGGGILGPLSDQPYGRTFERYLSAALKS